LRRLLEELDAGDMVTLLGAEGMPQALLVSLRSAPREAALESCWEARWDPLAQRVSEAWQGEESAVELLSEMRR
jgi:hypothetical protein